MGEAVKKTENVKHLVAPLMPANFRQYEHEIQQWVVYADPKATDKDLETPAYWSNVSNYFRIPAEITIIAEDGTWKKWATVHAADRNWAKVTIDYSKEYSKTTPRTDDPTMEVEWAGPNHKWRVLRKSDGDVLSKGHQTRDQAETWVKSHSEALKL